LDKRRQIGKAILTILKTNFNICSLGMIISPRMVTWEYAIQFRNDIKKNWRPRVIHYFVKEHAVSFHNGYHDIDATHVGGDTILTMAENRSQAPEPPKQA
jgi:hypothetical protein